MWEKERYHSDEEFRLRRIRECRKYQSTKKGKKAMKKSYENQKKSGYGKKWNKKNPDYFSNYMKNKRIEAKKNKICTRCFKGKVENGFTICNGCRVLK